MLTDFDKIIWLPLRNQSIWSITAETGVLVCTLWLRRTAYASHTEIGIHAANTHSSTRHTDCPVWTWHHWNCQDGQWQNGDVPLACTCAHHGPSMSNQWNKLMNSSILFWYLLKRAIKAGDGPIVLILAPTRELAQQIYAEARKFGKAYNITAACAYGGGSLYEQTLACQEGCEILVCTPVRPYLVDWHGWTKKRGTKILFILKGRLIDLIKKKGTNLERVTYLVLDEADRMFDMGFEPQVRSIANHVRPDRQTLLFSATFKKRVEKLAREILDDPVRIIQGELGEVGRTFAFAFLIRWWKFKQFQTNKKSRPMQILCKA